MLCLFIHNLSADFQRSIQKITEVPAIMQYNFADGS